MKKILMSKVLLEQIGVRFYEQLSHNMVLKLRKSANNLEQLLYRVIR